jgi:hypothetical protein
VKIGRGVRGGCLSPIVFNFTGSFEGFGDLKIGGQVIRTVKYADELVLLAKEEMVLQGLTDRVTEIGSCHGMEMNVEKTEVMRM